MDQPRLEEQGCDQGTGFFPLGTISTTNQRRGMNDFWRLCLRGKDRRAREQHTVICAWAHIHVVHTVSCTLCAHTHTHTTYTRTCALICTWKHMSTVLPLSCICACVHIYIQGRYLLRKCSSRGPHWHLEPVKENPDANVKFEKTSLALGREKLITSKQQFIMCLGHSKASIPSNYSTGASDKVGPIFHSPCESA